MQTDPILQQTIVELLGIGDKLGEAKAQPKAEQPQPPQPKEAPKEPEVKETVQSTMSEEQKQSEELKAKGGELFKAGKYEESLQAY